MTTVSFCWTAWACDFDRNKAADSFFFFFERQAVESHNLEVVWLLFVYITVLRVCEEVTNYSVDAKCAEVSKKVK